MSVRKLALALLLGFATKASAGWTVVSSQETPSNTCRHIHATVQQTESGQSAQLDLAVCDLRKVTLRIIDQPNEPRTDLARMMAEERCLAGVNGGYFDPNYAPVGLLISDGRIIAPLRKARLLSGVLSVAGARVRLQRVSEFSMKSKIAEAVQCGPFLVDRGRSPGGLNDSRIARRTFVAVGSDDQIALGFCSEVSLAQLSRILLIGKIAGGWQIDRALNLDGGSSSAFWFGGGDKPFSIPEQKTVRDFIGIVAK